MEGPETTPEAVNRQGRKGSLDSPGSSAAKERKRRKGGRGRSAGDAHYQSRAPRNEKERYVPNEGTGLVFFLTTVLVGVVAFGGGVAVGIVWYTGTCSSVEEVATWNVIAAWRSVTAVASNPFMAFLNPLAGERAGQVGLAIAGSGIAGVTMLGKTVNRAVRRRTTEPQGGRRQSPIRIRYFSRETRGNERRSLQADPKYESVKRGTALSIPSGVRGRVHRGSHSLSSASTRNSKFALDSESAGSTGGDSSSESGREANECEPRRLW